MHALHSLTREYTVRCDKTWSPAAACSRARRLVKVWQRAPSKTPILFSTAVSNSSSRTQPAPACAPAPACPPPSVSSALHPLSIHFTAHVARHSPSLLTFPHRISFPSNPQLGCCIFLATPHPSPSSAPRAPRPRTFRCVLFVVLLPSTFSTTRD